MKMKGIKLAGLLILAVFMTGCHNSERKNSITIAEQFGIAYAPLMIMKEDGILEKKLPDVKIVWKQFGGPTAIREAMLSKDVDFGFMGISPVLIGIDNGMDWKYASGISSNQAALITDKPSVNTLADFTPKDRIAILSPGCTQHVLLCMLAKEQLGDANALDDQIVSMSHPDAANALIANTEISAHFATPPYIQEELNQGMHIIADGEAIMGESFTFISCVAMTEFHDENPKTYDAFMEALKEAIRYINQNPEEAVKRLSPVYGINEEEFLELITGNGTIYSERLNGIEKMKQAMYDLGFIKTNPSMNEITFDNVNNN